MQYENLQCGRTSIPIVNDLSQLNPDLSLGPLLAKRPHHLLAVVHTCRGAAHPQDATVPPARCRCQLWLLRLRLLHLLFLIVILVKLGLLKRRPLPSPLRGAVIEESTE